MSRVFKLGHHQDSTNALLLVPTGGVEVSDAQGFQRNNFYAMVELLAAQCSLSCKRLSFSGMPARSARARLAASIQNRIAFMNCMRCDLILALPMPQNAVLFFYRRSRCSTQGLPTPRFWMHIQFNTHMFAASMPLGIASIVTTTIHTICVFPLSLTGRHSSNFESCPPFNACSPRANNHYLHWGGGWRVVGGGGGGGG